MSHTAHTILNPPLHHAHAEIHTLETSYLRNFVCCGETFPDLHALYNHRSPLFAPANWTYPSQGVRHEKFRRKERKRLEIWARRNELLPCNCKEPRNQSTGLPVEGKWRMRMKETVRMAELAVGALTWDERLSMSALAKGTRKVLTVDTATLLNEDRSTWNAEFKAREEDMGFREEPSMSTVWKPGEDDERAEMAVSGSGMPMPPAAPASTVWKTFWEKEDGKEKKHKRLLGPSLTRSHFEAMEYDRMNDSA